MPKQNVGSVEVYTFPLPPASFDPLNASPGDLERHGFPRRPDPAKMPRAATKWLKAFRRYPEFEHIAPQFKALEHRHGLNRRTQEGTEAHVNATSTNWSGGVLFVGSGDRFTSISGAWTVPSVYAAPGTGGTQYCSEWLGIDGDGSGDVMQAGTETDSDGSCYAWFEWYPNYSIAITNFAVRPGDVVSLGLCATSPTTAWASMGNVTAKQYMSFAFSAPPGTQLVGNCAEAIVERPQVGGAITQLPRYGEVFFDDTVAYTANGLQCPIGLGSSISMVDGATMISVPEFEADTDSFNVLYGGP